MRRREAATWRAGLSIPVVKKRLKLVSSSQRRAIQGPVAVGRVAEREVPSKYIWEIRGR